eukprot:Nitzschia sp. Nitz4//scaffold87_size112219//18785//19600//NITZ4_004063-RA/size112219-processed-gene-0.18-mRNA-1//-1//CDS//3329559336//276//frame0
MFKQLFTLFALFGSHFLVSGADTEIDWAIPTDGSSAYDPIEVSVGDTIVFNWVGTHSVFIYPSMSCDDSTDAVEIGSTTGASYTFQESDGSPEGTTHFFVCGVGQGAHCNAGQQIMVTVFSDDTVPESVGTVEIDWGIPADGSPYETMDVLVGDTLIFNWAGTHNVKFFPSMSCDDSTGAIDIGSTTGTSYTFQEGDGSVDGTAHFIVCGVGSGAHCNAGQNMIVNVYSSGDTASTDAPTTAPTEGEGPSDGGAVAGGLLGLLFSALMMVL